MVLSDGTAGAQAHKAIRTATLSESVCDYCRNEMNSHNYTVVGQSADFVILWVATIICLGT